MGNKTNFYKKPFFITKKSIPIWIGSVSGAILLIFFFGSYFEVTDEIHAVNFLNVNAELLVTILAVTMSFTLLGLQFLAESYTPRALGTYLKDKVIYGFPIIYISLITLSMFSVTFPGILSPIAFIQYALIGTVFSLVYLIGFVYYVIAKIQPEKVISDTSRNISDDVWKEIIKNKGSMNIHSATFRPFIILEQTMIKAVNNNDIFSYVQGLQILFDKLEVYLENIQNEFLIHKKPAKRGWDSDYVYTFFFRLFSQLFSECLTHSREQFIIQYQWHLFKTFSKLYNYRHTRALDDFWEEIEYLGNKIFNLEMIAACDSYLQHMKNLMKIEFELVKKNRTSYYDSDALGARYVPKPDDEKYDQSLVHDFHTDRIECLRNFAVISAEKRIEKLVNKINWILQDTLSDSLQLIDSSTRRMTVYTR